MEKSNKNRLARNIAIPSLSIILLLLLPVVHVMTSYHSVIIQTVDTAYYRGKYLFILGDRIMVMKGVAQHRNRQAAMGSNETEYSHSIIAMKDVTSIEILPQTPDNDAGTPGGVPGNYLGTYKVIVSGHPGYLYIYQQKGALYGSVKFPQWGKGAYESLRGLWIGSGQIRFTRSAKTADEVRRLGANAPFTQRYVGNYNASGNEIKGYYLNDSGDKNIWQATR